jgi:pheromone shutdown protein TraB
MNAWTASSIVALIGAIAFAAVAVITARARIGLPPAITVRDSSNPIDVPIGLTESAKKFRVLGWMLVLLLYLAAIFCLLQGLNVLRIFFNWEQWEAYFGTQLSDRAEIALYSGFWMAISVVLIFIGFWAQGRLRRRST